MLLEFIPTPKKLEVLHLLPLRDENHSELSRCLLNTAG